MKKLYFKAFHSFLSAYRKAAELLKKGVGHVRFPEGSFPPGLPLRESYISPLQVLRRDVGDVTHFLTVTHWESEEAIRSFAGSDILKAKYYPEDKDFLLEFESEVQHFEVVAKG